MWTAYERSTPPSEWFFEKDFLEFCSLLNEKIDCLIASGCALAFHGPARVTVTSALIVQDIADTKALRGKGAL